MLLAIAFSIAADLFRPPITLTRCPNVTPCFLANAVRLPDSIIRWALINSGRIGFGCSHITTISINVCFVNPKKCLLLKIPRRPHAGGFLTTNFNKLPNKYVKLGTMRSVLPTPISLHTLKRKEHSCMAERIIKQSPGSVPVDCLNTQSEHGRNLTPVPIVESARKVLGGIELDPASDAIANQAVKAERFYTLEENGFDKDWVASTLWLNPPGKTRSNGKLITASDWFAKLYRVWNLGKVTEAIGLVYRAGSIGSLGKSLLNSSKICLTCSGGISPIVNGSGRLSFETVDGNGDRHPQTSNTQSSLIFLLSNQPETCERFSHEFQRYGVIK